MIALPPLAIVLSSIAIVVAISLHKDCRYCEVVEERMAQNFLSHRTNSSDISQPKYNMGANLTEMKTKLSSKYILNCSVIQIEPRFPNITRSKKFNFTCFSFFLFGSHTSTLRATDTLFWTSDDINPGFQSQGASLVCALAHLCAMDSSESLLVQHLLASWWPEWQPGLFNTRTFRSCIHEHFLCL